MTRRFLCCIVLVAGMAAMLGTLTAGAAAQEAQRARPGTSATVATPRLADGHPDLNGLWYRRVPPVPTVQRVGASIILNPRAPRDPNAPPAATTYNPGMPKYKPELLAKVKQLDENQVNEDPSLGCGPPGLPRLGPPQRIVQTARDFAILYEDLNGNFFRMIPLDGRPHRRDLEASAHGDAVGRWEGDTLVIDTRNFNEDTWLSDNGLFHSSELRVTERLRRDGDTMTYEVTVEDPVVLVEPWKLTPRTLKLMAGTEIEEAAFCQDRDLSRMQDRTHHNNTR
jgi:hypothetical protein